MQAIRAPSELSFCTHLPGTRRQHPGKCHAPGTHDGLYFLGPVRQVREKELYNRKEQGTFEEETLNKYEAFEMLKTKLILLLKFKTPLSTHVIQKYLSILESNEANTRSNINYSLSKTEIAIKLNFHIRMLTWLTDGNLLSNSVNTKA